MSPRARSPSAAWSSVLPDARGEVFGERLPLAERYAGWLAGPGVERGLLGPREAGRLWDRHLLNSAVVAALLPPDARIVDVGSGAGLPGIPLALASPGCSVTLLEPLARRVAFLDEVVDDLGLASRVVVLRARAEDLARREPGYDVAVSRALAPLDRLAGWCLPLVRPGGTVVALKGERAEDEVAANPALRASVRRVGAGLVDPPTTVVTMTRPAAYRVPRPAGPRRKETR